MITLGSFVHFEDGTPNYVIGFDGLNSRGIGWAKIVDENNREAEVPTSTLTIIPTLAVLSLLAPCRQG